MSGKGRGEEERGDGVRAGSREVQSGLSDYNEDEVMSSLQTSNCSNSV